MFVVLDKLIIFKFMIGLFICKLNLLIRFGVLVYVENLRLCLVYKMVMVLLLLLLYRLICKLFFKYLFSVCYMLNVVFGVRGNSSG